LCLGPRPGSCLMVSLSRHGTDRTGSSAAIDRWLAYRRPVSSVRACLRALVPYGIAASRRGWDRSALRAALAIDASAVRAAAPAAVIGSREALASGAAPRQPLRRRRACVLRLPYLQGASSVSGSTRVGRGLGRSRVDDGVCPRASMVGRVTLTSARPVLHSPPRPLPPSMYGPMYRVSVVFSIGLR